jgi:hypothetical protein
MGLGWDSDGRSQARGTVGRPPDPREPCGVEEGAPLVPVEEGAPLVPVPGTAGGTEGLKPNKRRGLEGCFHSRPVLPPSRACWCSLHRDPSRNHNLLLFESDQAWNWRRRTEQHVILCVRFRASENKCVLSLEGAFTRVIV